jgi:uncharacterized OsmC-like protein
LGTFGGALEARQVDASGGRLTADIRGEVENEDGVLLLTRIHAAYTLRALEEVRETVEKVHNMRREYCPIYRSTYRTIEVATGFELV